ncbi:recombinase family protein [Micropruina sp.]|uniref:recombinase family protein n=1 Tax=Micropruina sp. TaxID=2737536 RepID=UPI0039E6D8B8
MKRLRAIGYVRVSTGRQEAGPEVQVAALALAAQVKGWHLDLRREKAASAKSLEGRPVLAQALDDLRSGQADMLAVSRLDRLSRSVADFAHLLGTAHREGWHLACLDLDVDTTTSAGRFMAHVMAAVAEFERGIISERTRDAMAVKKAEGKHMGRRSALDPATTARIVQLHRDGHGPTAICQQLTDDGTPTATGAGRWHPASIRRVILWEQARQSSSASAGVPLAS